MTSLIGCKVNLDPAVTDNDIVYGKTAMGRTYTVELDNAGVTLDQSGFRIITA